MPKLTKRLTDKLAATISPPDKSYKIHICGDTPGFGVLVTRTGARSWVMERRTLRDGKLKTTRRTLGKAAGRGAISADAARKLMVTISSELQQGQDRLEVKRAELREAKLDISLKEALRQYVEGKRRGKDGLPLKARTKADYLRMVEPGGSTKNGKPRLDGELYPLAARSVRKIHGDDARDLYEAVLKRSQRRATYAMQVLRAVLNWHGVEMPENPLGKAVPGRKRIVLPPTSSKPNPIPPERLGAWWKAASRAGRDGAPGDPTSADYLRFVLLTGVRGGESHGNEYNDGILVRDVDLAGARIRLPDTKNRGDHILYLSKQAHDIVKTHAAGKSPEARVFAVKDPGKTLHRICEMAGVGLHAPHEIRDTFASVAEGLVSAYTLKRMLNHSDAGDVTGMSYIGLGEAPLRAGWQTVADFIEKLP